MIIIKTPEEIKNLREGGNRLARVLDAVEDAVAPGVYTSELDKLAESLIRGYGDEPAFLHYKPDGASYPYPASLCVSVNHEIVHGIPGTHKMLREGDIVSIDCGLKHKNVYTDSARTVAVGKVPKKALDLMHKTKEALYIGIAEARVGNTVGDIGHAIEQYIKKFKYGIVRELAGHGVGREIHEDPYIPNYGKPKSGAKLKAGMVIAIEPMINEGTHRVILDKDGYTFKTEDGLRSAHFEHTVLITDGAPEILTESNKK